MHRQGITACGKCKIASSARICSGTVIGKPYRPLINAPPEQTHNTTIIMQRVHIGYYCIVGAGSIIESEAVLDDFTVVECGVHIGKKSLAIYRAQFCNDAHVGEECVIGGLVGERVIVGNRCRIFGKVIHSQNRPEIPWDAPDGEESSASIADEVFIGFNATVIGRIAIGKGAYVCAGAIVTKDVPPWHIVHGANKIVSHREWKGNLSRSLSSRYHS